MRSFNVFFLSKCALYLQFRQKHTTQSNIFQALRKGITTGMNGLGQGHVVLIETVPLLKRILSPQFRSVAVQLLSQR